MVFAKNVSISIQENLPPAIVDVGRIRQVDARISGMPPSDSEVTIRQTPGLISREIRMNAGSEHRSKVHNSEHQYIVSYGSVIVRENDGPPVLVIAPFHGITKPGTWRHLFMPMPCVWTTFHATDKTTIEELEKDIIQPIEEESK